ncbi:MAG TPA: GH116 family glycosyl hydrolase, partial [Bacteroidota bacterium]|nr:GH116 family glycosyl hydrolase [Bacteroidota bacterium]
MRVPRPLSSASIASACLLFGAFGAADAAPRSASAPAVRQHLTVGYCTTGGKLSAEDSAAVAWVRRQEGVACRLVDAATVSLDRPGVDIVWIHVPDSVAWISWKPLEGRLRALGAFFRRGGKFLFTGLAAQIPFIAGIESVPPDLRRENITDDWLFDQKGFQGFRGHPLFDGLYGGTFTWDTDADNTAYRVGYFDGRNPREGNVVGVEKSYVTLESDNRLMIEYGGGRGICIGAFVRFGCVNADRSRLELLLRNTLRYIAGERSGTPPTWWWKEIPRVRRFSVATRPLARSGALSLPPGSGLLIRRSSPCREFFDIAGRRTLLMGRENGGIDELWVQPFRVLRDFRCGLVDGDSIVQLAGLPVAIEIRPESLTRRYATRFGGLEEIVFPSLRRGGALVRYAWLEGARGCPLIIRFRSDLRLMWPYDERAPGDLLWAYDAPLHALHVRDRGGDFTCVIGANATPRTMLTGEYSGVTLRGGALRGDTTALLQVYHAAVFDMAGSAGRGLVLAVAGTDLGGKAALADYRALLADPASEYRRMADHYREMFARMLTLETPDTAFDARWRWALVGADRCIMETPRLGTALVAGFSTTEQGWDGAQRVSGRPGYAWYFGRDAEWSGLAFDACGGAETVRRELEFLQRHQDVTGKILHEMTASGVVHYDAADATPLYIVLAADYLRASGDLPFIRASWPHIERAMNFLLATDTDGDSLIENTGVGHGWVEGGKLWPAHTEFYLAGIWGQALQDAAWMASLAGREDLARRYARDARFVKHEVDSTYWNPRTRFYDYGRLRDGTYNPEPTVLPAAVMLFGWLDHAKSLAVLRRYAGSAFSADWGMRIVGDDSPLFNPRGYHEGSVWPLFSGWTALAAYAYGNSVQGFTLMSETMDVETHWAAGFVQEVLDGAVYAPSGVCSHQCWSETAILHPGACGMIGWKPDATTMTAALAPRFPVVWDRVRVRNLGMGGSTVDLAFDRNAGSASYWLRLTSGAPVTIVLRPDVLPGTTVTEIALNGKPLARTAEAVRGLLTGPVRVTLHDSAVVTIAGRGGVGVVPPVPAPVPGDSSGDFRFLG